MNIENNSSAKSSGIGFTGLLQIAFIVLKLTNVISWDWIYVLLPAIISFGILIIFLVVLLVIFIVGILKSDE